MLSQCPKCGADFIDICLGDIQVTTDACFVDALANCTQCEAELTVCW